MPQRNRGLPQMHEKRRGTLYEILDSSGEKEAAMKPPIIRQSPLTGNWYYSRNYELEGNHFKLKSKIDVTEQIVTIIRDVLHQEEEKRKK